MKEQDYITAKELYDAFVKDKIQAEKVYGNRTMRITEFASYVGPDAYTLPSV